jgi:hypothetical protein
MRTNLGLYENCQVFLNHPFDEKFEHFAHAMHFAVVAAGFVPVCALDWSVPDRPRLEMLTEAITKCHYSAHDFSRCRGYGAKNFARFNMPIEMGMALFHGLHTQRSGHRCAFFVAEKHDYKIFASDLSGLDPKCYENDDVLLVVSVYEWLRGVAPESSLNRLRTTDLKSKYEEFKRKLTRLEGNGKGGRPSHDEAQELMFSICSACGWWDYRRTKAGRSEFPVLQLSWRKFTKK